MKLTCAIRIILTLYDAKQNGLGSLSLKKLQEDCRFEDRPEFRRFLSLLESAGLIQCVALPGEQRGTRVILRMGLKEITLQRILMFTDSGKAHSLPDYMRDVTMQEVKDQRDKMNYAPEKRKTPETMLKECWERIEAKEQTRDVENALKYQPRKYRVLMN